MLSRSFQHIKLQYVIVIILIISDNMTKHLRNRGDGPLEAKTGEKHQTKLIRADVIEAPPQTNAQMGFPLKPLCRVTVHYNNMHLCFTPPHTRLWASKSVCVFLPI